MDHRAAFDSLRDLFPQVDSRVLKAVAFEHSDDIDAAVEFILDEVLPSSDAIAQEAADEGQRQERDASCCQVTEAGDQAPISSCTGAFSDEIVYEPTCRRTIGDDLDFGVSNYWPTRIRRDLLHEFSDGLSVKDNDTTAVAYGSAGAMPSFSRVAEDGNGDVERYESASSSSSLILEEEGELLGHGSLVKDLKRSGYESEDIVEYLGALRPITDDSIKDMQTSGIESEDLSFSVEYLGAVRPITDDSVKDVKNSGNESKDLSQSVEYLGSVRAITDDCIKDMKRSGNESKDLSPSVEYLGAVRAITDDSIKDLKRSGNEIKDLSQSVEYFGAVRAITDESIEGTTSLVNEKSVHTKSRCELPEDIGSAFGERDAHYKHSADNRSELSVGSTGLDDLEEEIIHQNQTSRSGNVISLDLLEDFMEDVKENKKVLVSAVESVVEMMKEAEIIEERAKQAKEDASSAGENTRLKAEELKRMLQHAKQANDMHAGEVYGEKSVLSFEARELQSRLLNLLDERNKSFSVIEEIRGTIEARIAAARDEIERAEQEKLEKERLGQEALKEQEAYMELVVQESKRLQQEAEANARLRDFLMDRGHVLDTLQGEMAVICEDILVLKRKVDDRAPLKSSLLLSTYSKASTASASSHRTSVASSAIGDGFQLPLETSSYTSKNSKGQDSSSENGEENQSAVSNQEEQEKIITTVTGNDEPLLSGRQKTTSVDDWEFLKYDSY